MERSGVQFGLQSRTETQNKKCAGRKGEISERGHYVCDLTSDSSLQLFNIKVG